MLQNSPDLNLPPLVVEGLGKAYRSYGRQLDMLKEIFLRRIYHREKWALRDVSFQVQRGKVGGVIGPNGAGKSTLLKIVAGLLDQSEGSVSVNGRISAILELGTGFHPDYSGRANIITGGMCLGMTRAEIEARVPWIIEFSELHDVIDEPFRTYSSGMQARLTFSTAISVNPDILIVDEALAAGDSYFVNKCLHRIREICDSGSTVLFVSHSTYLVIELCNRAVWIDHGEVQMVGDAYAVSKAYEKSVLDSKGRENAVRTKRQLVPGNTGQAEGTEPVYVVRNAPVEIDSISLHSGDGAEQYMFLSGEDIVVRAKWSGKTEKGRIGIGMRIDSGRTQAVAGFSSDEDSVFLCNGEPLDGCGTFEIRMKAANLGEGQYFITLSVKEVDFTGGDGSLLFLADRLATFSISRRKKYPHQYACELDYEMVEKIYLDVT